MIDSGVVTDHSESPPYYLREQEVHGLLVRETQAKANWFRFHVGENIWEQRDYYCAAMTNRRFSESVKIFVLYGYGETANEAWKMAQETRRRQNGNSACNLAYNSRP